jgi:hypothetical protein
VDWYPAFPFIHRSHFGVTRHTTSAVRKTARQGETKGQENVAFNKAYDRNGQP